ncbi:hypothetical protein MHK_010927 [Candidatus Magnetomorum sp. HK-1]|nr:hypothetical protein MHK_010927 [Candidatus Magnetomorum sp. HK-1]
MKKQYSEKCLLTKEQTLIKRIQGFKSMVVAFSGGVDSSYLLFIASQALGNKNVLAVTARAPFFSRFETQHIEPIIKSLNVRHCFFDHNAMSIDTFIQNPPDRCYHCKKLIFTSIRQIAKSFSIQHIAHGANLDDLKMYRPGLKASKEFNIESPLVDAKLSKQEIQLLAQNHRLSNWNQPAMACLATRIPYYDPITLKKLSMIDRAEKIIHDIGFSGSRVRLVDGTAKIEISKNQLASFFHGQFEDAVTRQFKEIGFISVNVDRKGYQSGFDDALYMAD